MNRQDELCILNGFCKVYNYFPDGEFKTALPPLPDFVLHTSRGARIGIEVTEVFQSEWQKQQSAVKDKITDKLVDWLQTKLTYPFTLNVFIDPKRPMWKAKQNALVEKLADLCLVEFGLLPDNTFGQVEHIDLDLNNADPVVADCLRQQGYRNLPSGIARIRIHRYDGLPYSYNSKSEGGLVPDLTMVHIEQIVKKEERLLANQPVLDENWLLIREGNYFTGSFDEIALDLPMASAFGKIFLFRTGIDTVFELK